MLSKVRPRDLLHEDYLESFQKYRFLGPGITGPDKDGFCKDTEIQESPVPASP